ncbi:spermidine synthase (plasmid) [Sphingobium yanoikuyae]|uniref:Spermidine synthase n=2 Tax=Sphingobium yanoikuyae TaxID=13690 RepID=A0A6P1GQS0_SPHYA|nr:spermidine synthase [Sphingobium yanoikuyae]
MFEELAWENTPIGELVLRRRRLRLESEDIWEIKLNDGYLMSSQFVEGEIALADLALATVDGNDLDVVIGGLGLGYTVQATLRDERVGKLTVIELIPQVIAWHRRHLLPLGEAVAGDRRCRLREGDFFTLAKKVGGFDAADPDKLHDVILIDIDHSTTHFIDPASASFYDADAIAAIIRKLKPDGVFALWSTDAEDGAFVGVLHANLQDVRVERVEFPTPYRDEPAFNLIYIGRKPASCS